MYTTKNVIRVLACVLLAGCVAGSLGHAAQQSSDVGNRASRLSPSDFQIIPEDGCIVRYPNDHIRWCPKCGREIETWPRPGEPDPDWSPRLRRCPVCGRVLGPLWPYEKRVPDDEPTGLATH